jgi:O-antigen biosynthesis protein
LFQRTTYSPFEVVVVDNGSTESATETLYGRYIGRPNFRLLRYAEKFNFGRVCNFGAQHAKGGIFVFLNNDTEVLHSDWLDRMAQWFEFKNVGIVGAKLLYPDGTIQHAGVILGMGGLAAHVFAGAQENTSGLYGSDCWYRNVSAVTGACMMITKDAFTAVNGFDENFLLNWSDVDLCLRAAEAGYRTVYTPEARLLHHESVTHQRQIPRVDFERASQQWRERLMQGDRFYNPNLNYGCAIPGFRLSPNETAIQINLDLMSRLPKKELISLPDDVK